MMRKVNPVIPESLLQVCAHFIVSDSAITLGALSGNFELNVMMPLIAYHSLQSIRLLANAVSNFSKRCIDGLTADRDRCEEMVERSLALATALAPRIGYDEAARIAKRAYTERKTIRQIAQEEGLFSEMELSRLLDPRSMVSSGRLRKRRRI
jgi:fumarate hydratase class II